MYFLPMQSVFHATVTNDLATKEVNMKKSIMLAIAFNLLYSLICLGGEAYLSLEDLANQRDDLNIKEVEKREIGEKIVVDMQIRVPVRKMVYEVWAPLKYREKGLKGKKVYVTKNVRTVYKKVPFDVEKVVTEYRKVPVDVEKMDLVTEGTLVEKTKKDVFRYLK